MILSLNTDTHIILSGQQGPPGITGLPGNGSIIEYPFSWGDATPAAITSVAANKVLYKAEIYILAAFDTVSSITLGDSLDNSRIMSATDNNPNVVGTYQNDPGYLYTSLTSINLYITLGSGNSTGSGIILLYIQN